jgi:hypothetical protein
MAKSTGLKPRKDIQYARKLLSEGGIQAVRDAVGKGLLPAALLSVLMSEQRSAGRNRKES